MNKALKLAKYGLFTTAENPRVGCVLVKENKVIASAYHQRVGEKHAEAIALEQAGEDAKGCTAYVTLEPCSHTGKNPPCADALIKAQIKRVVVCNDDPNPLVAGGGYKKLKDAGIEVVSGVLSKKGMALNKGFLHRMETGMPWVRCKSAQSLDGRTAMANGDSYWITGKKARKDVQYWRGRSGAVITGIETVLQDDCLLNFRPEQLAKKQKPHAQGVVVNQPLRVIVDSQLRTPLEAKILQNPNQVLIATASDNMSLLEPFKKLGIKVITLKSADGRVDLKRLISYLGMKRVNEVLVESGATLSGSFVDAGLINELLIYTAPVLMGSKARPLFELNIEEMANRHHITNLSIKPFGKDWRIRGFLK